MRQSNYCLLFTKNTSWYGAVIRQSRSKTACRGFKSFCPCQTPKSEKRLEQAIFRTFLFDISSKKSHGARSENTVLTLKKSSKCSSGGNKSNVSVRHIIKISAVFDWLITKLFADFKKILRNTSVWCAEFCVFFV